MVNVQNTIPVVSLEDAKAYLRIDHAFEDSIISNLISTATMNAEMRMKRAIINREGEEDAICENFDSVPVAIKQWVLMMVGHFYAHREATSTEQMSNLQFVDSLLDAWRLYE